MQIHDMTAWQIAEKLQEKEISAREAVAASFERIDDVEDTLNAFLCLTREHAMTRAEEIDEARAAGDDLSPTAGVPVAYKDLLCTDGFPTTCGSKMLENFVPPYDATTVRRCRDAGLIMCGKTNMDEFAMGSSTENSAFKITSNPWDPKRVPGGSSGGSAAAVAGGEAPVALGSDTGGSIRQPSSLCGLVGMKPTYGRVSRYGLIAYASSLDQVGPLCKDVRDCAMMMNILAGHDDYDATSADVEVPDYTEALGKDLTGLRGGIAHELLYGEGIDPGVRDTVEAAVKKLESLGVEFEDVTMPHAEYSLPCYYIIAPAECSSNLARFDGVRYGHRTDRDAEDIYDMFAKSRAEGFGPEVTLRIIKGTYVLSAGYYEAYYRKALKVRTLIKQDFDEAFDTCDFLICPTSPTVAFNIGEKADDPLAMKLADICTIPVNLAGIPALNVPCGFADDMPVGMQLMGRPFGEGTLLQVAYAYEQATDWHSRRPQL
ncbi:MAG: Asp-tRNA(Asn)/Glu-tRNA(Gln) amidotransferase subunit GatA [Armatimonadota bacterium]